MTDCELEQLAKALGQAVGDGIGPLLSGMAGHLERMVAHMERQDDRCRLLEARLLQLESLAGDMGYLKAAFFPDDDDARSEEPA